jgi:hypothetical protein
MGILVLFFGISGQRSLFAQVDRGGIVGTVTDASGAVVPEAAITITNVASNQSTKVFTDVSGDYAASLLRIGTYTISVEKGGFKKTVRSNVVIDVGQVVHVDLTLEVGEVTQAVEVTGLPPLIQTETSSLGTVETEKRIVDLPLNQRNFIGLAYLAPGANSGQTGSNVSGESGAFENVRANEALSVNGLRVSNNNYLLNGVDNNEFGLGGIIALPPPDAIQEFRTEENSMSSEFGRGGAAVNVVIKSGTNEVHGGAYEFLRNDILDARNFFSPDKAPFRRNQFGAYLGGPIKKDHAFIFGDYQGTRLRQGVTSISTVPTLAMRQGDFSERGDMIYDPFTTDPDTFARKLVNPGNPFVIPADRINPVGKNIIDLYPLPNMPGIANNYVLNTGRSNNQDTFDIRVDVRITDKDQFFSSYSFGNVDSHRPGVLGDLGGDYCCPSNSKNRSHHMGLGWTHSIGANILNDLHGGAFRFVVNGLPINYGKNISEQLGIPNANRSDPNSSGLTFLEIAGFTPLGDSLWTPELAVENIFQIADTLSWTRGRHSLKFGIDFRRQQRNFFQETSPRGWYSFDGSYTQDLLTASGGNGMADMLLGVPSYFQQDKLQGTYPTRYWDLAGFVQDDLRLTPDLTLNLGLRYEVTSPANGRVANFDLDQAVIVTSYGSNAVSHAGVKFDTNNWAPRVGLAWSPGSKRTVMRGAFGVFYSTEANIFDDLGLNPPALALNSRGYNPGNIPESAQLISSGFPPDFVFGDPNPPVGTVRSNGPKRVMPYIMEWNLTVQHEIAHDLVAQAAYVATRGLRLWNHETGDLNQPPLPLDSNFSDSTGNFGRPYFNRLPDLQTIMPLDYPMFSMTYNALQTSLNKRFSNGFNMLASYTFAKNLGTADGNVAGNFQSIYTVGSDKGPVQPDIHHRFVVSYLYELPFGQGKKFLDKAGKGADLILGGWQVSGITVARSGEAYNASLSFDPTNTNAGSRPDRIHDPYDFSFDTATQQAYGCSSPGKQTLDCFFNQGAFVLPQMAPGQLFSHQFGNAGHGNLRGPDQVNFDFAILKSFRFRERHQLQFRTEFFNLFNHPQFALPGGGVDQPGGAAIASTLLDNEREIQFGLKYSF